MSRFCTNCGSPLTEEETFCHMCGNPVSSAPERETTVLSQNGVTDNAKDFNEKDNYSHLNDNADRRVNPEISRQMKNPAYNEVQQEFDRENINANKQNYASYSQNSYASQGNYNGQSVNQFTHFSNVLPKHGFVEAYKLFWQNYVNFGGRSRRSDYWYVVLMNAIIGFVGGLLSLIPVVGTVVAGILALLEIASFIPMIALSVRRLQDTGRNGLLFLLNLIPLVGQIILIVFYCDDSQQGRNEYGESPKYINNTY